MTGIRADTKPMADVVREVVTLVTAIINGDWETAWQSAQNILSIFQELLSGSFNNLRTLVTTVIGVIYTTVVNTLTDLGLDTETILTTLRTTFRSAWNDIKSASSRRSTTLSAHSSGCIDG